MSIKMNKFPKEILSKIVNNVIFSSLVFIFDQSNVLLRTTKILFLKKLSFIKYILSKSPSLDRVFVVCVVS